MSDRLREGDPKSSTPFMMQAVLSNPRVYDLFQDLLGGKHARRHFVTHHVRAKPGDCVLDIGCGTAQLLHYLPDVTYFGFDTDLRYIEAARARYGERGVFLHDTVTELTLEGLPPCDIVLATGVLHHLNDTSASRLFGLAYNILKPGGRLVTLDACLMDGQSSIARLLAMKDRGDHIREQDAYRNLAGSLFRDIRSCTYHRLLRLPYTHCVLEFRK